MTIDIINIIIYIYFFSYIIFKVKYINILISFIFLYLQEMSFGQLLFFIFLFTLFVSTRRLYWFTNSTKSYKSNTHDINIKIIWISI